MKKISRFRKVLLEDTRVIFLVWMLVGLVSVVVKMNKGEYSFNNFRIFRGVFWHTIEQLPLYAPYPNEYLDANHYGVFFSFIIAPFALLPFFWGALCWVLANVLLLFVAIRQLPFKRSELLFIYLFSLNELFVAGSMQQFNISTVALLVLAFCFVEKGKDRYATLCIVIGFLTKIYGIMGLIFFLFSKKKREFVLSGLFWLVLLFVLPMLYSSPDYVLSQYQAWFDALTVKNELNMMARLQNVSLLGMVRKITGDGGYSDLIIMLPGMVLFLLPLIRVKKYRCLSFRLLLLASSLLFIVLFSSGSEHSTYIIPYVGVGIWYLASPKRKSVLNMIILAFAFLGSFFVSDLMPRFLRTNWIYPYALKALPISLVWIKLTYELLFEDFLKKSEKID